MGKFLIHTGTFWSLLFLSLLSQTGCTRGAAIKEKPVVSVNSVHLSTQDFAKRLALKLKDYDALYAKDQQNLKRAKEQCVQDFVLEVLTRQYAKENSLQVSSTELEAESAKIRSKYPDDIAFRRALSQENISYDDWMANLQYSLLQKMVHQDLTKDLKPPTEGEIKSFYEQNKSLFNRAARIKLRQIVVEKEDVAKRLYKELQEGSDLGELAQQYSIAPEGENKGVTNWIEKGSLEVFDQAFRLNPGQRSKIIKSPYGYHIYEVIKKDPEVHLSLQEARATVERQLMEKKEQTAFSAWLDQSLRKSQVSRNEDLIQAVKVSTKAQ